MAMHNVPEEVGQAVTQLMELPLPRRRQLLELIRIAWAHHLRNQAKPIGR